MKKHILGPLLIFLFPLILSAETCPQEKVPFFKKGFIGRIYHAFDYSDSLYVAPSYYNWSVMGAVSTTTQPMHILTPEGNIGLKAPSTLSFTPYFGWRWLVAGYSVATIGDDSKITTLKLSIYPRPGGVDLMYQHNSGNFLRKNGTNANYDPSQCRSTLITCHVYYTFNHFKFSYSAAQAQGAPQQRSAGSFFLGLRYDHQNILYPTLTVTPGVPELSSLQRVFYHNIGITSGYTYNWVFAPKWLLSAGIHPGIGMGLWRENKGIGELQARGFTSNIIFRGGINWNGRKWSVGFTAISNNHFYVTPHTSGINSLNECTLYANYKFGLRKEFRKKKKE